MKQNFVTFCSPGTFVDEQTTKPIDSWDVDTAVEMSLDVLERYDAAPYGFYFTTREREEFDLDSRVTKRSGTYYLGGNVRTLQELKTENDPKNRILISNMEGNGWDKVIFNSNSWLTVKPLMENDVILEYEK